MRLSSTCLALLLLLSQAHSNAQTPADTRAILEGDVVNSVTGAPSAAARIQVDPPQPAEPLYVRSDAKGHFLFDNLSPAFYRVSVEAPGFLKPPV
jgi:hypothetical protein